MVGGVLGVGRGGEIGGGGARWLVRWGARWRTRWGRGWRARWSLGSEVGGGALCTSLVTRYPDKALLFKTV